MTWHTPSRPWSSGPWTLEVREDELADLRFAGRRVLRSVRAVVRDRNWDTAELVVDGISASTRTLEIRVHSVGLGSALEGTVRVRANESSLSVILDLVSGSAFWTNRTGLVVLQPPQAAGADLQVRHSDGSRESTRFPVAISPHQPVFDIAELAWAHDGLAVDVQFNGDVFEMEDQRNWTDASYKTYSRPLELPFPYRLIENEHVRQSIVVSVNPTAAPGVVTDADSLRLEPQGIFPDIVVGASTAPDPAPHPTQVGAAVLVELDLASPNWRAALKRATTAGLPLDVRLILSTTQPQLLDDAVFALRGERIARVGAFQPAGPAAHVSDAAATTELRAALTRAGMNTPVIGGARSHFTELNRERQRLPHDLAGIVFSITPLFHSRGTEQLVESLAIQRRVALQSVKYAGKRPVHIGPITLRPRFNNVATTPPPMPSHTDLSEGYGPELIDADDPRQDSPELGAWTIASAAALGVPGVASLAYFEEWGPRGLRHESGSERPVAAAIRALAALSGSEMQSGMSADGLLWAVGGSSPAGSTLIANVDSATRSARIRVADHQRVVTLGPGEWSQLRWMP